MQQQQQQQQHQHQQPPPTLNSSPSFTSTAITTEQIQKCLDDNKNLIMAILENQNLGKLNECAQYQAILQKNLMYLAAIADAQPPQPQPNPSQMQPNALPQQANSYMQQPQPLTPQQTQGGIVPKLPFQLNALRTQEQQQHLLQFQQHQQMQAQMGMRPGAPTGMLGMHQTMQSGMGQNPGNLMDARGNKQDGMDAPSGGDGQGKSASGRGSGNRDS